MANVSEKFNGICPPQDLFDRRLIINLTLIHQNKQQGIKRGIFPKNKL